MPDEPQQPPVETPPTTPLPEPVSVPVEPTAPEPPISEKPLESVPTPPEAPRSNDPIAPPVTHEAQNTSSKSLLIKALESIQTRKKAKLEKIMKLVNQKHSITNDQVEKLLHVSDATATRYLAQLVKEGKLKRTGPKGRPKYEVI